MLPEFALVLQTFQLVFINMGGRDVGQDDPGGLINCSSRRTVSDKGEEEDCEGDQRDDCEHAAEMDTEMSDLSDEDSNQANELERNVLRDSCLELDEAELSTSAKSTTSVGDNSDKTNKLSSSEFEFLPMAGVRNSKEMVQIL